MSGLTVRVWATSEGHKVTVTHNRQPTYQWTEYECECGVWTARPQAPRRGVLDQHFIWRTKAEAGRGPVL